MEKANEVASFFLWLIIAIFVLHVIQGDALSWIKSKFTAAGGVTGASHVVPNGPVGPMGPVGPIPTTPSGSTGGKLPVQL